MALQVTERISIHDLAVGAAARMYQAEGYEALIRHQPRPRLYGRTPFDLFIPVLERVQEVETSDTLPAADLARLRRCREDGLQVWVLVPLDTVAAAHASLKGAADHVIPFWTLEGDRVRFGLPRRP
jgi:hypothetical protein